METCAPLTGGRLKLVHAFYIGMLALKYRTPRGEKVIWPNQYAWLLQEGLIDWKDHALWGLSEENIRDKSNADGTVKLAALVQVSWFVAQSIMRRAHTLPLSQLESMTLSYIPLFAVTYFFWWVKPKDVMTPSVVDLPDMLPTQKTTFETMAVSNLFDDEGKGKQDSLWHIWYLTPRLFEKEAEDKALREAEQKALQEAQRHAFPEAPRRALTDTGPRTLQKTEQKISPISEQWLWRAAALMSIVSMLIFMQFERVVFRWGGPLTMVSLASPALYLLSRLVMIGGVIAAFRASDPRVYETYVVSTYWIHVL